MGNAHAKHASRVGHGDDGPPRKGTGGSVSADGLHPSPRVKHPPETKGDHRDSHHSGSSDHKEEDKPHKPILDNMVHLLEHQQKPPVKASIPLSKVSSI